MDLIKPLYFHEENSYGQNSVDEIYTDDKLEEARKWAEDNFTHIILPREANSESINDIEKEFVEYNSLPLKQRRIADWKAMELFGKTNQDIYEEFKRDVAPLSFTGMEEDEELYIDNNQIVPNSEAVIDMSDQVDYSRVNYTMADVKIAREWADANGLVIIVPCNSLEDLETLWDNFNSMLLKHRNISDWESEKIFGMTNLKHYIYLKKQYIKDDIEDLTVEDIDHEEDISSFNYMTPDHFSFIETYTKAIQGKESKADIARLLFEATLYDQQSSYYMNGIKKSIKRIIREEEIASRVDMDFLPSSDLPFYSPEEMIDMGVFCHGDADNFYGVGADNAELADGFTSQGWFEAYKYHFNGFDTPNRKDIYRARLYKLEELCFGLQKMKMYPENYSEYDIKARKQSILELGWNPELPFTPENRVKTNKLYIEKCNSHISTQIVNMKGFNFYNETEINIDRETLKPLYIVLTSGNKLRSKAIKAITMSKYSHCSIALDASLDELFSYDGSGGDGSGGFKVDSIKNYEPDQKIGIFTIFINNSDMETIKNNIEYLKKNIYNTAYSIRNLLSYAFHFVPSDTNNLNNFCSQFVDRILKSIGVDLTKKKSEYVAPSTFAKIAKKNNKIYNMYEGDIKGISSANIDRKVKGLLGSSRTIVSIKEGFEILRSFICKSNDLNRMVMIDESSLGEITKKIYETYISPCLSISEYSYNIEDKKDNKYSMNELDRMIRIFGKK